MSFGATRDSQFIPVGTISRTISAFRPLQLSSNPGPMGTTRRGLALPFQLLLLELQLSYTPHWLSHSLRKQMGLRGSPQGVQVGRTSRGPSQVDPGARRGPPRTRHIERFANGPALSRFPNFEIDSPLPSSHFSTIQSLSGRWRKRVQVGWGERAQGCYSCEKTQCVGNCMGSHTTVWTCMGL